MTCLQSKTCSSILTSCSKNENKQTTKKPPQNTFQCSANKLVKNNSVNQSSPLLNHPKEGSKTTFEIYTVLEGWSSNKSTLGMCKAHGFIATVFLHTTHFVLFCMTERSWTTGKNSISLFPSCNSDAEQELPPWKHCYLQLRVPQQSVSLGFPQLPLLL